MKTAHLLVALLAAAALSTACKGGGGGPEQTLAWHAGIAINDPIAKVEDACPQRICQLNNAMLQEIEYVADASGQIKAVVLRFPAQDPPSVQASQDYFQRVRSVLKAHLGTGESFLESGDPTYWPARSREERVATLTMDSADRTVLAIGPAGPDAEKIPATGAANKREQVQAMWAKVVATPDFKDKQP